MSEQPVTRCERVCEYAMDVGLPEFSVLREGQPGCGNCEHYLAPAVPTHTGSEEPRGASDE